MPNLHVVPKTPHLIIGIDVGTTGTGIAYLNKTVGNDEIKVFQCWSDVPMETESKVPTQLRYPNHDPDNTAKPVSWGFGSLRNAGSRDTRLADLFKIQLGDMDTISSEGQRQTSRYYEDFLNKLYAELRSYFTAERFESLTWEKAIIHFHFSAPAAWNPQSTNRFAQLIRRSNFSSVGSHMIKLELSEPQAAAAYELAYKSSVFKKGDTVAVIDAGGGTVDLCWLRIASIEPGNIRVEEIRKVQGATIGAAWIDQDFESLIQERLHDLQSRRRLSSNVNVEAAALEIQHKGNLYKSSKHSLGRFHWGDEETFGIDLPRDFGAQVADDHDASVQQGQMLFKWGKMKELFNRQINGISHELLTNLPDSQTPKVKTILLCGGLGSNTYVQQQIKKRVQETTLEGLRGVEVREIDSPQLCVCKGLVIHANQTASGNVMFDIRRANIAVGVLCQLDYDNPRQEGRRDKEIRKLADEKLKVTEINGRKVIRDYVQWLVHLDEKTDQIGTSLHHFIFPFSPDVKADDRSGQVIFVTCSTPDPPPFLDNDRIELQEPLDIKLSTVVPEKARMRDLLRGKKVLRVKVGIQVTAGQVKLDFLPVNAKTNEPLGDGTGVKMDWLTEQNSTSHPIYEGTIKAPAATRG